jgi:hypothetical protein
MGGLALCAELILSGHQQQPAIIGVLALTGGFMAIQVAKGEPPRGR